MNLQVQPSILSIDATEITLSWPMCTAGTGGGNPPTGYQVYMFPGVAINTLANPVTVYNEVQVTTDWSIMLPPCCPVLSCPARPAPTY